MKKLTNLVKKETLNVEELMKIKGAYGVDGSSSCTLAQCTEGACKSANCPCAACSSVGCIKSVEPVKVYNELVM